MTHADVLVMPTVRASSPEPSSQAATPAGHASQEQRTGPGGVLGGPAEQHSPGNAREHEAQQQGQSSCHDVSV